MQETETRVPGIKTNIGATITTTATTTSYASMFAMMNLETIQILWNTVSKPVLFLMKQFSSLSSGQKILFATTFALGFVFGRMKPFWKRFRDVNDIPSSFFGAKARVLVGRAASVTDGDTIRFLHTPTWFHPTSLSKGQKLSEYALPIRICSFDTPETAKFGKEGQPFGEEAKIALKDFLGDKKVFIRLLQKDQYSRAVAQVFIKSNIPIFGRPKYVDEHMLKLGLAEVYKGAGAVYGPKGFEAYNEMEANAKAQGLGIWSMGKRESAAEYKKRTKE